MKKLIGQITWCVLLFVFCSMTAVGCVRLSELSETTTHEYIWYALWFLNSIAGIYHLQRIGGYCETYWDEQADKKAVSMRPTAHNGHSYLTETHLHK